MASIHKFCTVPKFRSVFDLYKSFGNKKIGENLTQLQHATQVALLAEKDNAPNPVILAAFFHDIGHLVYHDNTKLQMGNYGVIRHEIVGSSYLKMYLFPIMTCDLIHNHVNAKRFLVTMKDNYYDTLSDASKETLKYQGGEMSKEELVSFISDPLYEYNIKLRKWNDESKTLSNKVLKELDAMNPIEKYYDMACKIVPH